jgi:hypothetical protein
MDLRYTYAKVRIISMLESRYSALSPFVRYVMTCKKENSDKVMTAANKKEKRAFISEIRTQLLSARMFFNLGKSGTTDYFTTEDLRCKSKEELNKMAALSAVKQSIAKNTVIADKRDSIGKLIASRLALDVPGNARQHPSVS